MHMRIKMIDFLSEVILSMTLKLSLNIKQTTEPSTHNRQKLICIMMVDRESVVTALIYLMRIFGKEGKHTTLLGNISLGNK